MNEQFSYTPPNPTNQTVVPLSSCAPSPSSDQLLQGAGADVGVEECGPTKSTVLINDGCFEEHSMDLTKEEEEYAEFLKKVERTIYLDSISPDVTESVLKAAFNQFGNVTAVQFIRAYLQPNCVHAVLLEMENKKQAEAIIAEIESVPFMVGGMPRPVRAKAAEVSMFADRPRKPGRRIWCRWLPLRDPQFDMAKKIQKLVKKHAEEAAFTLEKEVEETEQLAESQSDALKINCKKLELIEGMWGDGSLKRLAKNYGVEFEHQKKKKPRNM